MHGLVEQNNWANSLRQRIFFLLHNYCKSTRQLAQIHAYITSNGFSEKSSIFIKVLYLYTVYNSSQHAHHVFDKLESPENTKPWNQIIKAHSLGGNSRKSIELFNNMGSSLAFPDTYTYNYAINSCTKGGLLGEGEQIHGRILKYGFCSSVHVGTSLIDFYIKCGGNNGMEKAKQVFDEMPERNVVVWNSLIFGCFRHGYVDVARSVFNEMTEKNVVSWTTMISGCAQNGRSKEALTLFCDMRGENVKFDEVTLTAVLTACAVSGNLNFGKWIHSFIDESFTHKKQQVHVKLYNALIHMYASCGEIFEAFDVFRGMEQRSIVSWSSMITGFAKQGYGNEALSMFKWMMSMEGNNLRSNEIMSLGVLSACSHSGRVNEGRYHFSTMVQNSGVEPNVEHFACMADLFTRAGLLNEARELVKFMPVKPNDAGGSRFCENGFFTTLRNGR